MKTIPDFWIYDLDEKTGLIHQNNNSIQFLPLEKFLLYTQKEKSNHIKNNIILMDYQSKINKIYIITYIYYLLCNSDLYIKNKIFNRIMLNKLIELIKIDYFKQRNISYQTMKDFKEIYYILTNIYLCEYNNCQKNCCDKNNTLCSVHLRKKEKQAKLLEDTTNIPLDVCRLIAEY